MKDGDTVMLKADTILRRKILVGNFIILEKKSGSFFHCRYRLALKDLLGFQYWYFTSFFKYDQKCLLKVAFTHVYKFLSKSEEEVPSLYLELEEIDLIKFKPCESEYLFKLSLRTK